MRNFVSLVLLSSLAGAANAETPEHLDFFEKKIRPVLVEHCYPCHAASAKRIRGGLSLDSRDATRKGGDTGPAVVPGKPNESLLLRALRHDNDELRMPPKGKLPAAVLADFERWIALGAPDPRDKTGPAKTGVDFAAARKHWAFQPIRLPKTPAVSDPAWTENPIDAFIYAKLAESKLTPSPETDRPTLLRRLYYDLIGLPPTASDIEAFLRDKSPDATARIVDKLLASPQYGERWARHWLDVARYADTKDGVLMFGDNRIRPYAYTYRDYVVRAFNQDMPFDRFIHEQLAADLIEPKVEPWRLGAMGFLTLGRMFDNNVHDILDDRIDVVTRGLLGLTVSCARCHDHKYDAIPSADYYSLYGVFASSEAPLELPLIDGADRTPETAKFEVAAAAKRKKAQEFLDSRYTMLREQTRMRVGDYLVHVATTKPDPLETAVYFLSLAPDDLRPPLVARWRRHLENPARAHDPIFRPWFEAMTLPDASFAEGIARLRDTWNEIPRGTDKGQLNPLFADALGAAKVTTRKELAQVYGAMLRKVYQESKKPGAKLDAAEEQLLEVVAATESPGHFPRSQTRRYMSRGDTDAFGGMLTELDRMAVTSPHAPPRAMVLVDAPDLHEPHVFLRGNAAALGEKVPRRFLELLSPKDRPAFPHGSGRLDLAKAITASDNPLTVRVLVNRVWMHHFGEPLVATPSDFGVRSTPPTHPDLLDYLASTFQQDGWSLKKLHRRIVLSRAYRQTSLDKPDCRKVDPENRLLWRANRRRLDFESMRDTLLAVSGRLDPALGGRPVDIVTNAKNGRRTLYGLIDRQSLPGLYRSFDFPVPDGSIERRPMTTVPQQALFGMNSPFLLEQAKALTARPEIAKAATAEDRIRTLYRLVLQRNAHADEIELARRFVTAAKESRKAALPSGQGPWEQYAQVLLLTNELMFVD